MKVAMMSEQERRRRERRRLQTKEGVRVTGTVTLLLYFIPYVRKIVNVHSDIRRRPAAPYFICLDGESLHASPEYVPAKGNKRGTAV